VDTLASELHTPVLIGNSEPIRLLRAEIEGAARSTAKVLILGETGSGKEVTARLVHGLGARKQRRFVAMNCSGVPETLLESELFGHTRGSFTGAFRDKPGLARVADGGTLFLDEVGEMSLRMQAVVLRFVETGEVQPIGASSYMHADVRLIAATNRDLVTQIAGREFREDLYYRLNVVQIRVPALRERPTDVVPLMRHFLAVCSKTHGMPTPTLTPAVEAAFTAYRWPGNVRELKNVAERLVVKLNGAPIREHDLPRELHVEPQPAASAPTQTPSAQAPAGVAPIVEDVWNRMRNGESFWATAHAHFKAHDMTRADLRALIRRGLEQTRGNYRQLVELFNMESSDYRRFLSFLYQYDCNLPFQPHRSALRSNEPFEQERAS
jgi:DNA-binding NtrC family response regulator